MHQFRRYAEGLQQLAQIYLSSAVMPAHPRIERALNGEAADKLFSSVPVDVLRRSGAFFTPAPLAAQLIDRISSELVNGRPVLDPACGAGDLLLACARKLEVMPDLEATLQVWGRQLHGFDIHREFVIATKARLVLLALARGARGSLQHVNFVDYIFPNIRHGDFLGVKSLATAPGCVVINPPFQRVRRPKGVEWSTGLVTKAALFVDHCIDLMPKGTPIAALLPDVLRSGTNYRAWRQCVEERTSVSDINPVGVFSDKADVDVFLVTLTRVPATTQSTGQPWLPASAAKIERPTLDSLCHVRVGPVVPFRDPHRGARRPYATTAVLPPWKSARELLQREYDGEVFQPPFVAVRRTSRPNDSQRAIATIVRHSRRVAVENHVIVLLPHDGTVKTCRYLLNVLKDPRTTAWLNERICCRHLTTRLLKQLPLWLEP